MFMWRWNFKPCKTSSFHMPQNSKVNGYISFYDKLWACIVPIAAYSTWVSLSYFSRWETPWEFQHDHWNVWLPTLLSCSRVYAQSRVDSGFGNVYCFFMLNSHYLNCVSLIRISDYFFCFIINLHSNRYVFLCYYWTLSYCYVRSFDKLNSL